VDDITTGSVKVRALLPLMKTEGGTRLLTRWNALIGGSLQAPSAAMTAVLDELLAWARASREDACVFCGQVVHDEWCIEGEQR